MTQITHDTFDTPRRLYKSQARWGAIVAGIFVSLAILCFLHLLGLALGVSIVDLSDAQAIGTGLAIGVVIWSALSWCAAIFLGAMLSASLSGEGNEAVGLLNGVTLWATTSILVLVLGFNGITSVVGGTFSVAGAAVSASASAVKSTGGAVGSAVSQLSESDSAVADEVSSLLKEQASQAMVRGNAQRGASAQEIRRSIDQLDPAIVRAFAGHLIEGDFDAATDALASNIAISERDLDRLVERTSKQIQQMLGTAGNDQPLSADLLNRTKSALASGLADLDAPGGPEMTTNDVRSALDGVDTKVMQTIAWRLVQGDADGARHALVANTSLSSDEADDLISGIEANLKQTVTRYREQAAEYADHAGDYAQGVLWSAFFISTLSLGASALGGWLGTHPVVRRTAVTSVVRSTHRG